MAAFFNTAGQETTAIEIEQIRQQFQEQRAEIEKLREEIRKEVDLRNNQQKLLEAIAERLAKLGPTLAAYPEWRDESARRDSGEPRKSIRFLGRCPRGAGSEAAVKQ